MSHISMCLHGKYDKYQCFSVEKSTLSGAVIILVMIKITNQIFLSSLYCKNEEPLM